MVLRFLSDEDFDATIVRGLLRRLPSLDLVSVRDVGLSAAVDPVVLEWAALHDRTLLTHDVNTMIRYGDERVRRGENHPGIVKVPQTLPVGRAIEDLVYVSEIATVEDMRNQVLHLPL